MFWGFIIISALGFILVKLGSYSVWMIVLSGALKLSAVVIAVLIALIIWNKFFRSGESAGSFHSRKPPSKNFLEREG